jgi:hypothetical protein
MTTATRMSASIAPITRANYLQSGRLAGSRDRPSLCRGQGEAKTCELTLTTLPSAGLQAAAPETDQAGRASRAPEFRRIPEQPSQRGLARLGGGHQTTSPVVNMLQDSRSGVAEHGATTRSFCSQWRIYSRRHEDKGRLVISLPGTRNSSIHAFPFQLCRIPWNIYDWIMLDVTVDLDNSSYGKRSICILARVFAVDFGNRIIQVSASTIVCAKTAGPQTIVKAAMIEAAAKRVC